MGASKGDSKTNKSNLDSSKGSRGEGKGEKHDGKETYSTVKGKFGKLPVTKKASG